MALAKWGGILMDSGKEAAARSDIWPLVKFDLEWVVSVTIATFRLYCVFFAGGALGGRGLRPLGGGAQRRLLLEPDGTGHVQL